MIGLFGKKHFEFDLRMLPERALPPHFVRLRVYACGVCGTVTSSARMDSWTPLGHESPRGH